MKERASTVTAITRQYNSAQGGAGHVQLLLQSKRRRYSAHATLAPHHSCKSINNCLQASAHPLCSLSMCGLPGHTGHHNRRCELLLLLLGVAAATGEQQGHLKAHTRWLWLLMPYH
jgi:hypothetical protein